MLLMISVIECGNYIFSLYTTPHPTFLMFKISFYVFFVNSIILTICCNDT